MRSLFKLDIPFSEEECLELIKNKKHDGETLENPTRNSRYYLKIYKALKNNKITFNWSAFLLGPYWMLYRKMYLYTFIFFLFSWVPVLFIVLIIILIGVVINLILGICDFTLIDQTSLDTLGAIFVIITIPASFLIRGYFGNHIYFYHLSEKYKQGKRKLGVDLITPIILPFAFFILVFLIYIIWLISFALLYGIEGLNQYK